MINLCLGGKQFRGNLAQRCPGRCIWGVTRGGNGFHESEDVAGHGARSGASTPVLRSADSARGDTAPAGQHPSLPQKALLARRREITGPQKFQAGRAQGICTI